MSKHDRVAHVAAKAKERVDTKLGHIWWAILLRGVLALGLAICAFVWPEKTLGLLIKLLGAYFLVDGVIGVIGAVRSADKTSPLMQTIVSLAMGLVLLLWTGISAKVFLILVGIWLVLQGIGLFMSAMKINAADAERGLTMIIGGVMALIGLVFVFWTDTGVVTISWLIGFGSLVLGCLLVFLATRVKQLQERVDRIGDGA